MSLITAHLFRIGSDWQRPPDGYQEAPIPEAGLDLTGRPIRQGYKEIVFVWSYMDQEDMTRLMTTYNALVAADTPKQPIVYIDKDTGSPVNKYGMIHEPVTGTRLTVFYQNVSMRVSRITDS